MSHNFTVINSSDQASQSFLRRNFIPFIGAGMPVQSQMHCKAIGCNENHSFHICRSCGDQDATHRMRDCRGKSCKAMGCDEIHSSHFCRSCGDQDSNHRTQDCRKKSCKAMGCDENHSSHFCRSCGDQDSRHLRINCPTQVKTRPTTAPSMVVHQGGFHQMAAHPMVVHQGGIRQVSVHPMLAHHGGSHHGMNRSIPIYQGGRIIGFAMP